MILTTSRTTGAYLTFATCLALVACSDAVDEAPTPSTTDTSTASTSDPAVTTSTPSADGSVTTTAPPDQSAEEHDQADIKETLELYTGAMTAAFNGEASIEEIYPYTKGTAREQWTTEVMAAEAQGYTFSGETQLEVLEVSVDGDSATVLACADVSTVEAIDENGDSIIAEDRLDRTLNDFVLVRDDSAAVGWYVVEDTNRSEPCDG
ncbi:hypothetical protein [Ornithinimicrobium cryptoxanthini]|uniref:Lipoprotein n=1 Tax=Ornithinimicrobium cryptoxanthini TaxID=2934161 RepID=A0ABY4YMF9_9MICO|nr:hypothetical protein [Ornithinimicrobium cryptoxanthini]USQ77779.1 hypothetical protein NF557_07755 [Ornithinimicrobium cryptoxanthini]